MIECELTHKTPEGYRQIQMVEKAELTKAQQEIKTLKLIVQMHREAAINVINCADGRVTVIKDLKAAVELSKGK